MQSTSLSEYTTSNPYTIKVSGYQSTQPSLVKSYTFTVTVAIDCTLATITSSAISAYSYTIGTSSQTITSLAWTTTLDPNCPITYSLIDTSTGTTPTSTFTLSSNSISVYTTNNALAGQTYTLKVIGTITSTSVTS